MLAYGQTGTGKTHTMGQPEGELATSEEHVGVTYRAVRELFAQAAAETRDLGATITLSGRSGWSGAAFTAKRSSRLAILPSRRRRLANPIPVQ